MLFSAEKCFEQNSAKFRFFPPRFQVFPPNFRVKMLRHKMMSESEHKKHLQIKMPTSIKICRVLQTSGWKCLCGCLGAEGRKKCPKVLLGYIMIYLEMCRVLWIQNFSANCCNWGLQRWQSFQIFVLNIVDGTCHAEDMTWLVVCIPTPLKNMSSSVGVMNFPIYGKITNVPNHKPVTDPNREIFHCHVCLSELMGR